MTCFQQFDVGLEALERRKRFCTQSSLGAAVSPWPKPWFATVSIKVYRTLVPAVRAVLDLFSRRGSTPVRLWKACIMPPG